MKDLKELFVPEEIGKKLKEKGFDEPCLAIYIGHTNREFTIAETPAVYKFGDRKRVMEVYDHVITAPLWQQVIEFFEEKYSILIQIERSPYGKWFGFIINDFTKTHKGSGNFTFYSNYVKIDNGLTGFSSRSEALQSGIEKALELI
jgi:hypothetical protein